MAISPQLDALLQAPPSTAPRWLIGAGIVLTALFIVGPLLIIFDQALAKGLVVFRDNLIACVHRHDASARDGPADRGAGLGRGGRPSSS